MAGMLDALQSIEMLETPRNAEYTLEQINKPCYSFTFSEEQAFEFLESWKFSNIEPKNSSNPKEKFPKILEVSSIYDLLLEKTRKKTQ